jgi:hypothetical protein
MAVLDGLSPLSGIVTVLLLYREGLTCFPILRPCKIAGMKKMACVVAAIVLGGCSHRLVKPGGTDQDFYRDLSDCRAKVGAEDPPRYLIDEHIEDCMMGYGWRRAD